MSDQASCARCGARPPSGGDPLPLTWTTAVENGRRRVVCERCAREHLRAIEARLDSDWW